MLRQNTAWETYLEAAFVYFKKNESGVTFDTRMLFAIVTPMSGNNDFVTSISLREAYVIARSVWASFPEIRSSVKFLRYPMATRKKD